MMLRLLFTCLSVACLHNTLAFALLQASETAQGTQSSSQQLPAGSVQMFAGLAAPAGWLLCNGSQVSRSNYKSLFAAIGTVYGQGDGQTTFNLPDFRGKAPIGAGAGVGLTQRPLGSYTGAETHTLSATEMPAHTHAVNDPGHTHEMGFENGVATRGRVWCFPPSYAVGNGVCTYGTNNLGVQNNPPTITATSRVSVQASGNGAAHNNMQPSLAINFIIKF